MPSSNKKLLNDDTYLIDAHCHLDFEVFDPDRAQVLQRAKENNITDIIIPGTQYKYWDRIKVLCFEQNKKINDTHLHSCFGLHPYWTNSHKQSDLTTLEEYLVNNNAVALGECGLDFRPQHINKNNTDKATQTHFFEAQLGIANNLQLPVVIHAVNATQAVIESIKKLNPVSGMIHSFSGSSEQAKQLIDLNFLISIGGSVTYPQAKKLRKVVNELPLTSLLIETDAPDQSDYHNRNNRNEPAFLINTVKEIAQIKNETEEIIARESTNNAKQLFGI